MFECLVAHVNRSAFLMPADKPPVSRKPAKLPPRSFRHLVFLAKLWAGLNKHIQDGTGSADIDAQILAKFGPWRIDSHTRVEMREDILELVGSQLG